MDINDPVGRWIFGFVGLLGLALGFFTLPFTTLVITLAIIIGGCLLVGGLLYAHTWFEEHLF